MCKRLTRFSEGSILFPRPENWLVAAGRAATMRSAAVLGRCYPTHLYKLRRPSPAAPQSAVVNMVAARPFPPSLIAWLFHHLATSLRPLIPHRFSASRELYRFFPLSVHNGGQYLLLPSDRNHDHEPNHRPPIGILKTISGPPPSSCDAGLGSDPGNGARTENRLLRGRSDAARG